MLSPAAALFLHNLETPFWACSFHGEVALFISKTANRGCLKESDMHGCSCSGCPRYSPW